MSDPKNSRGYRNRNPGNIDWNRANKWQGQVGIELSGSPPRFAVFETHEYGIRALASLLTTYQDRHGLRTVRGIINRWAPPVENVTSAYVSAVARAVGVGADQAVDLHDQRTMRSMVVAIIHHELGGNPYDAATIDRGLRLAGLVNPDAAATPSPGADAVTLSGVAGAAAALTPAVSGLSGLHWAVGVAVVVGAVAIAALVLLRRQRAA